jgi:anti-sigma factor ChrR (cupin superfamily)
MDAAIAGLVRPDELPWIDTGSGNAMKVLRVSSETGAWTALIRARAGTTNARHRHLGPADFYVVSGSIEYRAGVARAGDWIYEPAGALHEATHHPEDTVYLANVYGPIAYLGPDDTVLGVSDWQQMARLQQAASAPRTQATRP